MYIKVLLHKSYYVIGMKIELQTNKYECGLCVLVSMHNYFYANKITKQDLYKITTIKNNGISIYELEIIADKLNLDVETYKANYSEFKKYNNNDYFVTYIKSRGYYHFVIIKKTNNLITIFDSSGDIKKYSYDEFEDIFCGCIIEFSKRRIYKDIQFPIDREISKKLFLPKKLAYSCLMIIFDLLFMSIGLIGSGFIKIAIDKIIPLNLNENIFFIGLFFILLFIFQYLSDYFATLIKMTVCQKIMKENILIHIDILKNKQKVFFDNIDKKVLMQYPHAIGTIIIKKYLNDLNLISDVIYCLVVFMLVVLNSYIYLIGSFLYLIIVISISYFKNKLAKENYEKLIFAKNDVEIQYIKYYDFLISEKNIEEQLEIEKNCHKSAWTYYHNYNAVNTSDSFLTLLDNSFSKLIYCFLIMISCFFISEKIDKTLNISGMVYSFTLLSLITTSFGDIFKYFASFPNYKKSKILINDFLVINNKNFIDKNLPIKSINKIELKNLTYFYNNKKIFDNKNFLFLNNTLITGKNGVGKSTLMKIISLFIIPNEEKFSYIVNEVNLQNINQVDYDRKIIYLPSFGILQFDIEKLINHSPDVKNIVVDFLKESKLNLNQANFSQGEIQMLNYLSLLGVKNKVILLDEAFSNLNQKWIDYIFNKIHPYITKNNFVICVSHTKGIKKYFNHHMEL